MSASIFILIYLIWLIGIIILFFKKGVHLSWKLSTLLIYIFFGIWYYPVLALEFSHLLNEPFLWIKQILLIIVKIIPFLLFLAWPLQLLQIKSLPKPIIEKRIRNLVLITLFYWLMWFTYSWLDVDFNLLLFDWIKAWEMPNIPIPPVQ